ncbi:alpha/beta fold hydrolase [Marinobacter zhejiangensis]|uniref:Pimeloyl-ACP methyl ester carboxylesterase n=1 Tax=Marinobacter zhejiangensis TaxID=488535 RepID=A0A1I4Q1Z1_9GAMM|nr:alpha/beta hydrolase [Marinobacter zhejiangensis]SFM34098.1 Pimeloyl-ACP methyl ester carboxylesterase [Marinobacter zhejiangensis]
MAFADVNGQRLYYEDTGGNGPVVVFSHGLLMDHDMFAPQVAALRDRFRCITWDERGHGQTAVANPEPFSYYDSADDLAALLTHLGITNAVLVGMSQGGFLSLRCALTHPDRVRALVMLDSQAGAELEEKIPMYQELIGTFMTQGLTPVVGETIAQIILGNDYADSEYWKAKWKTMSPANIGNNFQTLASRDDLTERLPAVTQPTLIIHGDADIAIPMERAQVMADRIPDATLAVIPGAGHAANLSHPEPVNQALTAFLNRLHPELS